MPGCFSSPKSPLTTAVFLYDEHVLNLAPTVLFLQLSTENKQGNKQKEKKLAWQNHLICMYYSIISNTCQQLGAVFCTGFSLLSYLLPPRRVQQAVSLPRLGSPTLDPIGESHQGALLQREQWQAETNIATASHGILQQALGQFSSRKC